MSSHEAFAGYEHSRAEERVDSLVVAIRDTVREVTTIIIREDEAGDTVFQSVVTDRTRVRDANRFVVQNSRSVERRDTVFVERSDSVYRRIQGDMGGQSGKTALPTTLKWIFAIVVALIGLKVCPYFRREL